MSTLYLVDLEAVETRYTGEWKRYLPKRLSDYVMDKGLDWHIKIIAGSEDIPNATTPGAFLNFGGTNMYKSSQLIKIAELFCDGKIKSGDKFLYTDAWNPTILQVKYMSELLRIPVEIHALWHAGSYDPQDFLGRLIGNKPWVRYTEKALMNAIDCNWFATQFHIDMFRQVFDIEDDKIHLTGWPMEYLKNTLSFEISKKDIILFPHRLATEKQVEIFKDLARRMPEYEFIVCQDKQLTKAEYHALLRESKIVFSANLQETLGISCYEAVLAGALPMVPSRLSYTEMYSSDFVYPSIWTSSWENYTEHANMLVGFIQEWMRTYELRAEQLPKLEARLERFFNCDKLLTYVFNVR
jgi:glycosyltransferase involved in cell wall biosynthesis